MALSRTQGARSGRAGASPWRASDGGPVQAAWKIPRGSYARRALGLVGITFPPRRTEVEGTNLKRGEEAHEKMCQKRF